MGPGSALGFASLVRDDIGHSRGADCVRAIRKTTLDRREGAGNAGCFGWHPQPRVQVRKAHELVTTGTAASPTFPARWCYGLLRALPGVHDLLVTVACGLLRDLAPAKGRQDHTPSPSATCRARRTRCRVHRIPLPTLVTIAKRPSRRRDGADHHSDLGFQST